MSITESARPRSLRKAALLHAAAELFATRGYRGVSTDDIGNAVGISGPAVYRHFASKGEILLTLCESAMDFLMEGARRIVDSGPNGDTLADLVDFHIDFAVRERAVLAVYLREQRELPAKDLRALRRRQREYEAIWCDVLAGRTKLPDGDVRAAVKLVLSMINGSAYVKDAIPRPRLVVLLDRLTTAALANVESPEPPAP